MTLKVKSFPSRMQVYFTNKAQERLKDNDLALFLGYSNTLFYFFYTADGCHFRGLRIGCFLGTIVKLSRFLSTK